MNKNDPDPATAPFSGNLEKAETGTYPNLASVPVPPMIASTTAERQKLATDLTSTRTTMQANGGTASPGAVPPPPAIPPSIAAPEMTSLPGVPLAPPKTPLPALRPMDEPPAPQPPNTTLQVPGVGNVPLVEKSRSGPPPGQPSTIPQPASSALPSAVVQSGNPQPSPPVATLPPPQLPPQVAALPPPKLPPVPVTVASLDVAPGAAALAIDMRPRLADVVKQYKERPRTVRVVSYAAPAVGGAEQLNSFRSALDRAQIVAKELADAGIPAKQIQTEASPSVPTAPTGRIEVQLLP
ncbi:MAG TPA: hypothetical protein VM782_02485 [Stellaceae bacterium]|nr:hypothetical protein [Stellaceae bacterium]